jgi:AcrR family transcriptional regulator
MKKRNYRLRQRANQQLETRERIVEAAVALHEEIGPAATTISALATRAGVQRLTVYRHFADESEIFEACSSKWLDRNPPPDPAQIGGNNPLGRTRAVLWALYEYYAATEAMWRSLNRDRATVAALEAPMARFDAYLETLERDLLSAWSPRRSRSLRATIGHALEFTTWQSLAARDLDTKAMAALACAWIETAAG